MPQNNIDRQYSQIESSSDLERNKFIESPSGLVALRVFTDSSIPVFSAPSDTTINVYNEILSVASGASPVVVSYTVPTGKKLYLNAISFSGDNIATYTILNDSIEIAKQRTYFNEYNGNVSFGGLVINEGSKIDVVVNNYRDSISDFNGNIQGVLL